MATQVIKSKFVTEGGRQLEDQTKRIGKEQTRLGQASASAGRAFSAQANGLGGLVGAYAAAAANVFAITAAFAALSRAAQSEQTVAGLNTLAAEFGLLGTEVANSLDRITKGQLSVTETAQQANLAISAGLGDQLEGLAEVSLKASRALGRNLTDAFQRVVRGAGKLEPELLDELGIFTRIEPAVQKFALQTGKAASSLTNFERRQAFANAVVEEGLRKFSSINTVTETNAEKLEKLAATITNIGLEIGGFVAGPLASFASFITNNASAAVLAIGFLFRQIFGRALGTALEGFDNFVSRGTEGLTRLSLKAGQTQKAFVEATNSIRAQAANVGPASSLLGGQAGIPGRQVLARIRAGDTIAPAEAKSAARALNELADSQTRFITKQSDSFTRAQANQKALRGLATEVVGLEKKTTILGRVYGSVLAGMTTATNVLRAALAGVVAIISRFLIVITVIEGALAIFSQITGTSISLLGSIANFFKKVTENARETQKAASDLAATFLNDLNTLGLTAEQLDEAFTKTSKGITEALNPSGVKQLQNAVQDFVGTTEGTILNSVLSLVTIIPALVIDAFRGVSLNITDLFISALELLGAPFSEKLRKSFEADLQKLKTDAITRELSDQIEEAAEAAKGVGVEARQAFVQLQALQQLELFGERFGFGIVNVFQRLNVLTGVSISKFKELADVGRLTFDSDGLGAYVLNLGTAADGFTQVTLRVADANGELNEFSAAGVAAIVAVQSALVTFADEFNRGAITAEKAGQTSVQVANLIARAERELEQQRRNFSFDNARANKEAIDDQVTAIAFLKEEEKALNSIKEALVGIEATQKTVNKQFASGRSIFEQGAASGIFNAQGRISKTSLEQTKSRFAFTEGILENTLKERESLEDRKNQEQVIIDILQREKDLLDSQLDILNSTIAEAKGRGASEDDLFNILQDQTETVDKLLEVEDQLNKTKADQVVANSKIQTQEAIIRDIVLGQLGNATKLADQIDKELLAQQRKTKQLERQLSVIRLQNQLTISQKELSLESAERNLQLDIREKELKLSDRSFKLEQARLAVIQAQNKLESQREKAVIERLKAESQIAKIQSDRNILRVESDFENQISAQRGQIAEFEAFANLQSSETVRQARLRLIELETSQQLAVIEARKQAANEEFNRQNEIINKQIEASIAESLRLVEAENKRLELVKQEQSLVDQRSKLELDRLNAQLETQLGEFDLIKQRKDLADLQATNDRAAAQASLEDIRKRAELLKAEAINNQRFLEAQKSLVRDQLAITNAQREAAGLPAITIENLTADFTDAVTQAQNILDSLTAQEGLLDTILSERLKQNQKIAELAEKEAQIKTRSLAENIVFTKELQKLDKQIADQQQKALSAESEAAIKDSIAKTDSLISERQKLQENRDLQNEKFKEEEAAVKRSAAERIADIERQQKKLKELANSVAGILSDAVGSAIEQAFDNIARGESITQGLREIFVQTFENIRKEVLKKTLIEPIQENVKGLLGSAFGFEEDLTPSVVSTSDGNAQLVKIAGDTTSDDIKGALGNLSGDGQGVLGNLFERLKSGFTSFSETIKSIFQQVGTQVSDIFSRVSSSFSGIGGGLMSGGSNIFSSIFGGVRGIFSGFGGGASSIVDTSLISPFASGGPVQKFANGGMMRDRVPALLEPGEFVIRKQAAKVAGAGNLAALNATGQIGGGNVSVNVTNTGTPQEATASPPRFDGEKMVIDIVMRDLSNNGPIRKTLRAGGAG